MSAQGSDSYSYPSVPLLYSISSSGCTSSGNASINCPTAGGVTITVSGGGFSSDCDGMAVQVGSSFCSGLACLSSAQMTCLLPAGAGFSQGVVVILSSRFSQSVPLVSYASATLATFTGCVSGACPRLGGTLMTLVGTNFGFSSATVLVGGALCTPVFFLSPLLLFHFRFFLPQAPM